MTGARNLIVFLADNFILALFAISGPVVALAPKGITVLVILMALLAGASLLARREAIQLPWNGLTKALLAFLVWLGLSILWSSDMSKSAGKYLQIIGLLATLPPLWSYFLKFDESRAKLLTGILCVNFILAWGLASFIIFYPAEFVSLINALKAVSHESLGLAIQMEYWVRVSNRGVMIILVLSVLFAGLLPKKYDLYLAGACVPVFLILLNSQNQSALLAFVLAGLFYLQNYLWPRYTTKFFYTLIALVAVFIVPFSIANYQHGWVQMIFPDSLITKASILQRTDLYYVYAMDFLNHPVLGQGLDSSASPDFGTQAFNLYDNENPPHHPHNIFLQLLTELGIIGLGIAVLLIFKTIEYQSFLVRRGFREGHVVVLVICALFANFFAYSPFQSWLIASLIFSFVVLVISLVLKNAMTK